MVGCSHVFEPVSREAASVSPTLSEDGFADAVSETINTAGLSFAGAAIFLCCYCC